MAEQKLIDQVEAMDKPEPPKEKKRKLWKQLIYIVLVLVVTFGAIIINLSTNIQEIFANIGNCDWLWILLIIGIVVFAVSIRALVLFCFARLYTKKYTYAQALACDQIGVFYCSVTPGASGGQPMQAYTYRKQGLHISNAVSILAMYSITYQLVLIVFGVISFVAKYDQIMKIGDIPFNIAGWQFSLPIWPLTIIGFLLNVLVVGFVFLLAYWKGFHHFIMGPLVTLLAKIKLVKNPDKTREDLRITVENFKIEFKRLLTNFRFFLLMMVLFFLFMGMLSSVPYFVGLALHNESPSASFWDAIFLNNYHQMVTGILPVPGAAGVSEYFFDKLFLNYNNPGLGFFYRIVYYEGTQIINVEASRAASNVLAKTANIFWRTLTFTLPVLASGFVTAFYHASPKEELDITAQGPSRKTLISLQRETMVVREEDLAQLEETTRLNLEILKAKFLPKKKKKAPIKKKRAELDDYDSLEARADNEEE